jgi:hypothetical protein
VEEIQEADKVEEAEVTEEAVEEEDSRAGEGVRTPNNSKSSSFPMESGEKLRQLHTILSRSILYNLCKRPTNTDKTLPLH